MRIIAPMIILIMMTSTLAGCTGGDPDGGGEMDSFSKIELIGAPYARMGIKGYPYDRWVSEGGPLRLS